MKEIQLTITFVALSLRVAFGQSTDGDALFDDSFLHEIRFELADTNLFLTTKDYQQLDMIVDGNAIQNVGFKRKGNISGYSNPNKYGIKIKTNKYTMGQEYDGIKEFTLHMNYQDPSMMREKLTYDICNDIGLISLRTAFSKVYINDVYWGLYTLVEGKDEMYKQRFDNRDMDAIESLDFGDMCYISNNPVDYDADNNGGLPTYIIENGDPLTAWPLFSTMIDKANNTALNEYLDTVSNYLNLRDFFTYQAVNVYLMNMDSYIEFKGNQIYVYDQDEQKWQITPWDFNASFGLWNTNNVSPTTYPMIPNEISNGCIASKLTDIPALKSYYLDAMCLLNEIVGDTTSFFGEIDFYKAQIQQAVYDDTRKHITNADFDNSTEYGVHTLFGEDQPALKTFVAQRLAVVSQGLTSESYDCSTAGVNPSLELRSFQLFPNPTDNVINVQMENTPNNAHARISDLFGREITQVEMKEHITQIPVYDLPSGIYIIQLIDSDEQVFGMQKFIRE